MKDKIIYSLNENDVQTVAEQEIGRRLSLEEINAIEDDVAENINWYEAIANAILENISK
ncbi:MAG: hypothetical protein K0B11_06910 [Mariniphaga sp.]|nr:hypothetical protein [Mariniphaga sp.]